MDRLTVADIIRGASAETINTDVDRSAGTFTVILALTKPICATERSVGLAGVWSTSAAAGRHIANRIFTGTVAVVLARHLTVAIHTAGRAIL